MEFDSSIKNISSFDCMSPLTLGSINQGNILLMINQVLKEGDNQWF